MTAAGCWPTSATDLSTLYDSNALIVGQLPGYAEFSVPTIADGKVFAPASRASPFTENRRPWPPAIAAVANAASYSHAAISPGSLISIFGSGLAAMTASAPSNPLPLSIADTSVTINGVPTPLLVRVARPDQRSSTLGNCRRKGHRRGANSRSFVPAEHHRSAGRARPVHQSERLRRGAQCRRLREFVAKSRGGRQRHFGFLHWTGPGVQPPWMTAPRRSPGKRSCPRLPTCRPRLAAAQAQDRICRTGAALPRRRADQSKSTRARERSLSADGQYRWERPATPRNW
jgi:hypothetical protein